MSPQETSLAHHNRAIQLRAAGRVADAVTEEGIALQFNPDFVEAWIALARSLATIGQFAEATDAANHAVALRPDDPATNYHLGHVLMMARNSDAAIEQFRHTIAIAPQVVPAYQNLANLLGEAGEIDETIALQRKVIELAPREPALHSNLLLSLHYPASYEPAQTFAEHVEWARRHAPTSLRKQSYASDRSPDRKLRIGYLSPDFNRHPVASFLDSIFSGHDREQFEIIAYSNTPQTDEMTEKLSNMVDGWRDIRAMNDDLAAAQIERDAIDILVDLAGHTAHNRATLMARGAAPVQVTYLGYPDTTGMSAVQYRLTDAHADPPGTTERFHTETLIRLPDSFLCYHPDDDVPEPGPPPRDRNGSITFGSFNNFAKVTEQMMSAWSTILSRVPNSRLVLKARALAGERARRRIVDIFQARAVDPHRLDIHGWTPYAARHQITQSADIALDTFPYHGTTTTCEVLWAGVPTITLAGATHVSRVGVSILSNIGRPEWIATDEADYITRAVALANDPARLADARKNLREQFRSSPLRDRAGFVRKLAAAYREMWRRWCAELI